MYPFAVSLKESIRTYAQANAMIKPNIAPLVAAYKRDVQELINEGFHAKWESASKLEPLVRRMSDQVNVFRDKVEELLNKHEKIQLCLDSLRTSPLLPNTLNKLLARIQVRILYTKDIIHDTHSLATSLRSHLQETIDELNLASYSNLEIWVRNLDKEVEAILVDRLSQALQSWLSAFLESESESEKSVPAYSYDSDTSEFTDNNEPDTARQNSPVGGSKKRLVPQNSVHKPVIRTSVHEILIRNQIMDLYPPLHQARETFLHQLGGYLGNMFNDVCLFHAFKQLIAVF